MLNPFYQRGPCINGGRGMVGRGKKKVTERIGIFCQGKGSTLESEKRQKELAALRRRTYKEENETAPLGKGRPELNPKGFVRMYCARRQRKERIPYSLAEKKENGQKARSEKDARAIMGQVKKRARNGERNGFPNSNEEAREAETPSQDGGSERSI